MTRRMIRAMENPYVNVIGHPTTRKIGRRDPVDADLDAVFEAGRPDRHRARDQRATPTGSTFATSTSCGRGAPACGSRSTPTPTRSVTWTPCATASASPSAAWLTKDDVINAWPLAKLRRFLQKDV